MPRPMEVACRFEEAGHLYSDQHGAICRSVTQLLKDGGCIDFSMVDPRVLERAAERGTIVHKLCAQWDKVRKHGCTLYEFLHDVPESLHGYLIQYEAFLLKTGFRILHEETERPRIVYIGGKKVGMCPDRVGYFPHSQRLTILDLKTGQDLLSHPLQLAGYSLGFEKVLQLAMQHNRVALYLEPEYFRLKHFIHPQDYHAFLDLLRGGGAYLEAWKQQQQRVWA